MASAQSDTHRWLGIVVVATAGLITACGSDATALRTPGAGASTPPPTVTSTTVTTAAVTSTTVTTAGPVRPPPATTTTAAPIRTPDCRSDSTCPSSEHRTGDACGSELIIDVDGYLEGRHDAEDGRPYQIDNAPAPTPADDDDDDATVGPQTRYRAGYVQGWCDGTSG